MAEARLLSPSMILVEHAERQPPPAWFVVALAQLVPLHRRVLLLAHSGYTYAQIGTALDLEPQVVMSHGYRAMTALRPPVA
jgi:DNA-directed RNA polymerase specialized sigma24 family protein